MVNCEKQTSVNLDKGGAAQFGLFWMQRVSASEDCREVSVAHSLQYCDEMRSSGCGDRKGNELYVQNLRCPLVFAARSSDGTCEDRETNTVSALCVFEVALYLKVLNGNRQNGLCRVVLEWLCFTELL